MRQRPRRHGIRRLHDRHIGECAQNGHILDRRMRRAVAADLQAGVRADDADVQLGVADKGPHLLAGAHGGKGRKRRKEHLVSARGQTGRAADKILLGDAELFQSAGLCVRVADNKVRVGLGDLQQLVAERHSRCKGLTH